MSVSGAVPITDMKRLLNKETKCLKTAIPGFPMGL